MNKNSSNSFAIYHNLLIRATAKQVFDAISLPEHLNNWWSLKSSGKPELHSEYNLNFTDAYNWYGKVVECEPQKSFFIKMTDANQDWNPTTFGFTIEEKENEIYLRFSHTGWPENSDHLKHSSYCWAMLLHGLKNYVEKGIVVPFEERE